MIGRLQTHFKLNTHLSMISDKKLMALLRKTESTVGWGQTSFIEVEGHKVFVKKVPLTGLEVANSYSTRNLYRIPAWYSYGIGSAGFGAFRELATHIKTTNWVRAGKFTPFPLLHNHRIIATQERGQGIPNLKGYVSYWNGSKTVERYMVDRESCKHQLIMFFECLTPFSEWIADNPSELNVMFRRALKSIDFLCQNNMIHFDAHLDNWLTDGKDMYLCDFGLLMDSEFELTESERQFYRDHRYYDYAQVIAAFGDALIHTLTAGQQKLVENELRQSTDESDSFMNSSIQMAFTLHKKKIIKLPAPLEKFTQRYQSIINAKYEFFHVMARGKKSSNKYPAKKLQKLLRKADVIN